VGLIPLLAAGDEMFVAVFNPLDRIAQAHSQPGQEEIFRIKAALGAEATADAGRNHPDFVFRYIHELQKRAANPVRTLA
jgi:hypothetical protein